MIVRLVDRTGVSFASVSVNDDGTWVVLSDRRNELQDCMTSIETEARFSAVEDRASAVLDCIRRFWRNDKDVRLVITNMLTPPQAPRRAVV